MKLIILIIATLIISGCDLIKPLPGKDSITVGKEGFGIDKFVNSVVNKAKKVKKDISLKKYSNTRLFIFSPILSKNFGAL